MWLHAEIVYGFNMPQDYDELMQFEAETDTSEMQKKRRYYSSKIHRYS